MIHFWNRLPSDFGLCDPKQDLAYMTAYMLSHYEIKAVEDYEMQKKMERAQSQAKGKR